MPKPTGRQTAETYPGLMEAIAQYTGRHVTSVAVYADPLVAGSWAVRAIVGVGSESGETLDLLITGCPNLLTMDPDDSEDMEWLCDEMEEACFAQWPPASAGRVTGWLVQ